ncbi:integrase catalytic domain-containing protein [Nephila pilipes]|uniref:Integrase catalytic domain-containing protein n=1 Tax=Nephila pilipes TaxID=299642 RepID=A0A8X6MF38_NEPPI|nr:integrase catalytic domain-containing protein [Nephila pilipes]
MNNRIKTFGALIDSGSWYSYISKHAIKKLGIKSNNKLKMQHMLFGRQRNAESDDNVYEVFIGSLDESLSLPVKVFPHEKICGNVRKISLSFVISELNEKGIILSDLEMDNYQINLLPGEEVVGILFLDQSIKLEWGLFLLKTHLVLVLT